MRSVHFHRGGGKVSPSIGLCPGMAACSQGSGRGLPSHGERDVASAPAAPPECPGPLPMPCLLLLGAELGASAALTLRPPAGAPSLWGTLQVLGARAEVAGRGALPCARRGAGRAGAASLSSKACFHLHHLSQPSIWPPGALPVMPARLFSLKWLERPSAGSLVWQSGGCKGLAGGG